MTAITDDKLSLVEMRGSFGLTIETYKSKLDMILELMDIGSIAREQSYYGSPSHLAALDEIEKRLSEVRRNIATSAAQEAED